MYGFGTEIDGYLHQIKLNLVAGMSFLTPAFCFFPYSFVYQSRAIIAPMRQSKVGQNTVKITSIEHCCNSRTKRKIAKYPIFQPPFYLCSKQ